MTRSARPLAHAGRRGVLATLLMLVGTFAGYGLGAWHFFRYLVPLRHGRRRALFAGTLDTMAVGTSRTVRDARGQEITVTRTTRTDGQPASTFRALSAKCPHLGCRVHWDAAKESFVCPCHMGVFDGDGVAVSGPPAKEGKNLLNYEVRVDRQRGWVFVMVPEASAYGL